MCGSGPNEGCLSPTHRGSVAALRSPGAEFTGTTGNIKAANNSNTARMAGKVATQPLFSIWEYTRSFTRIGEG